MAHDVRCVVDYGILWLSAVSCRVVLCCVVLCFHAFDRSCVHNIDIDIMIIQ